MTKRIALILAAAAASCGGKPPTQATSPAAPVSEPSAAPPPVAQAPVPADPVEPVTPVAPDPAVSRAELLASERTAWDAAKPVFDKACASCHTKAGKKAAKKKLDHFDMDSYPLGGHHTQTIGVTIRNVLGISGKKPTMPFDKPGSVQGDDLAKIKAWTDAWAAAEQAAAHPPVVGAKHDD